MDNPDFIIIGAGSSGCVMAERLSASGRHKVLVLEAGGDDRRFFVQMPLGYGKTFFDPKVNWMYRAEPDPGLAGNVDHWPRGRVLGGSSSINAMVWVRGHRSDFDDWRDAGNPGWGADEMCSAFRDVECTIVGDDLPIADARSAQPLCSRQDDPSLTRKWFRIRPGHRPAAQSRISTAKARMASACSNSPFTRGGGFRQPGPSCAPR
jgi:choline dehydrogenase